MTFFHGPFYVSDHRTVSSLGADIRALRKSRKLTLVDLAGALDRSVGWLSQVERDKSVPSIVDLNRMAEVLDVSISSFLQVGADPDEEGIIVRSSARRPIGSRVEGLTEALLSPHLTDDFEMLFSRFEPGSYTPAPVERQTQEVGYILSGTFELVVGGKRFSLSAGDSFRLRGAPFEWRNPGDVDCEIIWVISPPVY